MNEKAGNGSFRAHQQRYPLQPYGIFDKFSGVLHKLLAGSPVPSTWLYRDVADAPALTAFKGKLNLEIVSHCWQYSRFLSYQLSSLVQNPPTAINVTMTVYYSSEDAETLALLTEFGERDVPDLTWNWQELPPPYLFRRAIGRNLAAKSSSADWIWFTDCDETFQAGCLDRLNEILQGRIERLLYPATEYKTVPLSDEDIEAASDRNSSNGHAGLTPVELDHFGASNITRATGPLQITHGDIARAFGYCDNVAYYQKPAENWCKAHEDRVFRWLLGTQGVAIDLPGVYRIQHQSKGRQARSSWLRDTIRRWRYKRQRKQGR